MAYKKPVTRIKKLYLEIEDDKNTFILESVPAVTRSVKKKYFPDEFNIRIVNVYPDIKNMTFGKFNLEHCMFLENLLLKGKLPVSLKTISYRSKKYVKKIEDSIKRLRNSK